MSSRLSLGSAQSVQAQCTGALCECFPTSIVPSCADVAGGRIGGILGYAGNFYQDALYKKNFEKRGVEARLYAPMVSGESPL